MLAKGFPGRVRFRDRWGFHLENVNSRLLVLGNKHGQILLDENPLRLGWVAGQAHVRNPGGKAKVRPPC